MAAVRTTPDTGETPERPELPSYVRRAIEEQRRLMEEAGLESLVAEIEGLKRLGRSLDSR
jgi:hypothetical protein